MGVGTAGKIIKWGSGEGDENFGEENKHLKKGGLGKKYQVVGNSIHPWKRGKSRRGQKTIIIIVLSLSKKGRGGKQNKSDSPF